MINLLPQEMRDSMLYARRNTLLLRWVGVLLIVIVGIFVVVIIGQLYIDRSSRSYAAQIADAEERLKVQKLEETQKKVEGISNNVKLAVQVLSKQVLFSSLLKQIGAAIPQGAILTGLSIDKLEGGINLTANALNYDTATQVQINLQDPNNKIFEKADIINVQCANNQVNAINQNTGQSTATQLETQYPCVITVRALFAKNNPFTLISQTGGAQ